jgi:hypothetical protein
MDYRVSTGFLAVLCVLFGALLLSGSQSQSVQESVDASGLDVFYLYPMRCVECDLHQPGQCDFCTSYYDERVMELIGGEVGVHLRFVFSDVVERPNILVIKDDRMTLGDAKSKHNMANTLCHFGEVQKSCDLFYSEVGKISSCIEGYGIDSGSIIYHTNSERCPSCRATDSVVSELQTLEYIEGIYYPVYRLDRAESGNQNLILECLRFFDNIDYVPQLLCPLNGQSLTGEFGLNEALDFAEDCMQESRK